MCGVHLLDGPGARAAAAAVLAADLALLVRLTGRTAVVPLPRTDEERRAVVPLARS